MNRTKIYFNDPVKFDNNNRSKDNIEDYIIWENQLKSWIKTLDDREKGIIFALRLEYDKKEIANMFNIGSSAMSYILMKLQTSYIHYFKAYNILKK